jgi:putative flippase GtrA
MENTYKIITEYSKKSFKYLIIGGTATALYLGVLFALTDYLNIHYLVSAIISFSISTTLAFFAHKHITFVNKEKKNISQFIKFTIIATAGLILTSLGITFFVEILDLWYMLGAIITSGIVFVFNFLLNNFITFKNPTPSPPSSL